MCHLFLKHDTSQPEETRTRIEFNSLKTGSLAERVGFDANLSRFPKETDNIITPLLSTCFFATLGFY